MFIHFLSRKLKLYTRKLRLPISLSEGLTMNTHSTILKACAAWLLAYRSRSKTTLLGWRQRPMSLGFRLVSQNPELVFVSQSAILTFDSQIVQIHALAAVRQACDDALLVRARVLTACNGACSIRNVAAGSLNAGDEANSHDDSRGESETHFEVGEGDSRTRFGKRRSESLVFVFCDGSIFWCRGNWT